MSHPLDGCRAKLDWAEKHLDALSAEMKTFFEGDTYALPSKTDEADNSHVVFFEEREKVPIEWGLALGDVVHNARSALDHLVYQLVLVAGGTPNTVHQFPILDCPDDWISRVKEPGKKGRGFLGLVDPAHIAAIEWLQPYVAATGLPRLATLRDFSNTDKHRLIHVAYAVLTDTPDIDAYLSIPSTITDVQALAPDTPIENGAELARFKSHTDLMYPPTAVQPVSQEGSIWTPGPPIYTIEGTPTNSEMNVNVKFPLAAVFGVPGSAYTRTGEFRRAIADARSVVESFAPAFP